MEFTKKLKILEIAPYSAGGCGVWARARQEGKELVERGYDVYAFTTNFVKDRNEIAPKNDVIDGIKITRFPAKKIGGESFMSFHFEKEALELGPDIIIAHNYRHLHTTRALKVAEKLREKGKRTKVFLVTHAPFVEGNITRTKLQALVVNSYDKFIGPKTINKFDKILPISHWEIPYLLKIGAKKDKIKYIPNGIPLEFFSEKTVVKADNKKILFLGRIARKKKLETLIQATALLKDKKIHVEIVGPKDEDYYNELKALALSLHLENRITFSEAVYDLKEKINKIDSCKVFVLPSRVEGMPQSLIEAMARGKNVIGSKSIAIKDLIKDGKNGYLFEFDNPESLANTIMKAVKAGNKTGKIAQKQVIAFRWDNIINQIERLILE